MEPGRGLIGKRLASNGVLPLGIVGVGEIVNVSNYSSGRVSSC